MGYNTDYAGQIQIEPPASKETIAYIYRFMEERHVELKADWLETLTQDYIDEHGFKGEAGLGGMYLTKYPKQAIANNNTPPTGVPSLWCNFFIYDLGKYIEWSGASKTYSGAEWVKYIIEHFLAPYGHVCNGQMDCQGDDSEDIWRIRVVDNKVTTVSLGYYELDDESEITLE